MLSRFSKLKLLLEFSVIFGGLPLLVLAFKSRLLLFVLLWAGAIAAYRWLKKHDAISWRGENFTVGLKAVLIRFAIVVPIMALATWYFMPQDFLSFPRSNPLFWLLVMALYPLLSVGPQELLYRAFIYRRYEGLFGQNRLYIAASAAAFGYAHIIMLNPVAVLLSAAGGAIFARDYTRNRSLALIGIEHALYGCAIFTVGLGRLFFTGAAWHS